MLSVGIRVLVPETISGVRIETNESGLIKVDACLRVDVDYMYAVRDVVGLPALASTSMHQGRRAAIHAMERACPR